MSEETIETVKVKFIRDVNYKGEEFKAGSTADLESAAAERLISQGLAEIATAEKKEKKDK